MVSGRSSSLDVGRSVQQWPKIRLCFPSRGTAGGTRNCNIRFFITNMQLKGKVKSLKNKHNVADNVLYPVNLNRCASIYLEEVLLYG